MITALTLYAIIGAATSFWICRGVPAGEIPPSQYPQFAVVAFAIALLWPVAWGYLAFLAWQGDEE